VSVRGEGIERIRLAEQLPEPISHYTDAVRAGETMWVSGLLAVDRHGNLIGGSDITRQTEQVFSNLTLVLDRAGVGFDDVVKVVVYLVEIDHRAAVNEVRKRYFGESRPASTLVEVSALAIPGALVEVDAVVHVPRG
jgi:2-iminobutanoate/2-iminopropanoate deaminase